MNEYQYKIRRHDLRFCGVFSSEGGSSCLESFLLLYLVWKYPFSRQRLYHDFTISRQHFKTYVVGNLLGIEYSIVFVGMNPFCLLSHAKICYFCDRLWGVFFSGKLLLEQTCNKIRTTEIQKMSLNETNMLNVGEQDNR